MARSRTSARSAVVGAVVLAAALAGCSATNEITSQDAYSASDGVRAELGDLTGENLLIVAAAADEPGALQGGLTNRGDDPLTVTVSTTEDSSVTVRIPGNTTVLLGGDEGEEVVLDTPDAPGATTALTLSTGPGGSTTLQVPVLNGTLPEYADLIPTAEPTRGADDDGTTGTGSQDEATAGATRDTTSGADDAATAAPTAGTEG